MVVGSSLTKFISFIGKSLAGCSQQEESKTELLAMRYCRNYQEPDFDDNFMLEHRSGEDSNRGR